MPGGFVEVLALVGFGGSFEDAVLDLIAAAVDSMHLFVGCDGWQCCTVGLGWVGSWVVGDSLG